MATVACQPTVGKGSCESVEGLLHQDGLLWLTLGPCATKTDKIHRKKCND